MNILSMEMGVSIGAAMKFLSVRSAVQAESWKFLDLENLELYGICFPWKLYKQMCLITSEYSIYSF